MAYAHKHSPVKTCEKEWRKKYIAGLRCTCKVQDYTPGITFQREHKLPYKRLFSQQREGGKQEGVQRAAHRQPVKTSKQQRLSPIRREGEITKHTGSLW